MYLAPCWLIILIKCIVKCQIVKYKKRNLQAQSPSLHLIELTMPDMPSVLECQEHSVDFQQTE